VVPACGRVFWSTGERYRCGGRISTGFVESAVNQVVAKRFVKKQQMRWTLRGARLLLQVRVHVLNDALCAAFRTWYPGFGAGAQEEFAAQYTPNWMLTYGEVF